MDYDEGEYKWGDMDIHQTIGRHRNQTSYRYWRAISHYLWAKKIEITDNILPKTKTNFFDLVQSTFWSSYLAGVPVWAVSAHGVFFLAVVHLRRE